MLVLDKKERVLKALSLEEPDTVPISEMDIEIPIMETITGHMFPAAGSLQTNVIVDRNLEERRVLLKLDCYKKVGFDLFCIELSAPEYWKPDMRPDGTMVDLWGRVLILDKQNKAWVPYSTIFNTPEDFENFDLPNPDESGWTFATERAKKP